MPSEKSYENDFKLSKITLSIRSTRKRRPSADSSSVHMESQMAIEDSGPEFKLDAGQDYQFEKDESRTEGRPDISTVQLMD